MDSTSIPQRDDQLVCTFDGFEVGGEHKVWLVEPDGVKDAKVDAVHGDVVRCREQRTTVDVRRDARDLVLSDQVDDGALPDARFTEQDDVDCWIAQYVS